MAKNILHMITPLAHMSPFDVNMALDAGYDATASPGFKKSSATISLLSRAAPVSSACR